MGRVFRHVLAVSALVSVVAAGPKPPLIVERLNPLPPDILPNARTPASPLHERAIVGWSYQGCYSDSIVTRTLGDYYLLGILLSAGKSTTFTGNNSNQRCVNYCAVDGYQYAGTEAGKYCYCSATIAGSATKDTTNAACNIPCDGTTNGEICGGTNTGTIQTGLALTIYWNGLSFVAPTVASVLPTNWISDGCYNDSSTSRTLSGYTYQSTTNMSASVCIGICDSRAFKYAGVENGTYCYCGASINVGASLTASTDCIAPCSASSHEACGGINRINIFEKTARVRLKKRKKVHRQPKLPKTLFTDRYDTQLLSKVWTDLTKGSSTEGIIDGG